MLNGTAADIATELNRIEQRLHVLFELLQNSTLVWPIITQMYKAAGVTTGYNGDICHQSTFGQAHWQQLDATGSHRLWRDRDGTALVCVHRKPTVGGIVFYYMIDPFDV